MSFLLVLIVLNMYVISKVSSWTFLFSLYISINKLIVHSLWSILILDIWYTYLMPEMSRSQGICVGTFWLVLLCSVPSWLFLLKHQFCSGKEEPKHSVKIWNVITNCEFSHCTNQINNCKSNLCFTWINPKPKRNIPCCQVLQ